MCTCILLVSSGREKVQLITVFIDLLRCQHPSGPSCLVCRSDQGCFCLLHLLMGGSQCPSSLSSPAAVLASSFVLTLVLWFHPYPLPATFVYLLLLLAGHVCCPHASLPTLALLFHLSLFWPSSSTIPGTSVLSWGLSFCDDGALWSLGQVNIPQFLHDEHPVALSTDEDVHLCGVVVQQLLGLEVLQAVHTTEVLLLGCSLLCLLTYLHSSWIILDHLSALHLCSSCSSLSGWSPSCFFSSWSLSLSAVGKESKQLEHSKWCLLWVCQMQFLHLTQSTRGHQWHAWYTLCLDILEHVDLDLQSNWNATRICHTCTYFLGGPWCGPLVALT